MMSPCKLKIMDFREVKSFEEGKLPLNTLITNMPDSVYHHKVDWAFSSTQLKEIRGRKLPHFHKLRHGIREKFPGIYSSGSHLEVGSATHVRILEKDKYFRDVLVAKCRTRASSVFQELRNKNPDKIVITEKEEEDVLLYEKSFNMSIVGPKINKHPDSLKEVSLFTRFDGEYYKIKMDIYNPTLNIIMDLKTSANCIYTSVYSSCRMWEYDLSAYMYTFMLYNAMDENMPTQDKRTSFILSFVDKKKMACQSYVVDDKMFFQGEQKFVAASNAIKEYSGFLKGKVKREIEYNKLLRETVYVSPHNAYLLPTISGEEIEVAFTDTPKNKQEEEEDFL